MPNRSVGDENVAREVARLGRVADAITNPSDDLIERLRGAFGKAFDATWEAAPEGREYIPSSQAGIAAVLAALAEAVTNG